MKVTNFLTCLSLLTIGVQSAVDDLTVRKFEDEEGLGPLPADTSRRLNSGPS